MLTSLILVADRTPSLVIQFTCNLHGFFTKNFADSVCVKYTLMVVLLSAYVTSASEIVSFVVSCRNVTYTSHEVKSTSSIVKMSVGVVYLINYITSKSQ